MNSNDVNKMNIKIFGIITTAFAVMITLFASLFITNEVKAAEIKPTSIDRFEIEQVGNDRPETRSVYSFDMTLPDEIAAGDTMSWDIRIPTINSITGEDASFAMSSISGSTGEVRLNDASAGNPVIGTYNGKTITFNKVAGQYINKSITIEVEAGTSSISYGHVPNTPGRDDAGFRPVNTTHNLMINGEIMDTAMQPSNIAASPAQSKDDASFRYSNTAIDFNEGDPSVRMNYRMALEKHLANEGDTVSLRVELPQGAYFPSTPAMRLAHDHQLLHKLVDDQRYARPGEVADNVGDFKNIKVSDNRRVLTFDVTLTEDMTSQYDRLMLRQIRINYDPAAVDLGKRNIKSGYAFNTTMYNEDGRQIDAQTINSFAYSGVVVDTGGEIGNPEVELTKTTQGNFKEGETIKYNFRIKNIGNVNINTANLNDDMLGGGVSLPTQVIPVGESITVSKDYKVTLDDVRRGYIENVADITAGSAPGAPPTEDEDSVTTELTENPGIRLVKTVDSALYKEGDTLKYSFEVTNTGDTTIENIEIDDPMLSNVNLPTTTLAPGATTTATADYEVTSANIDALSITNDATVTGVSIAGTEVADDDSVTTQLNQLPSIKIDKSSSQEEYVEGDEITYTFKITNEGNVKLSNLTFVDEMFPDFKIPFNTIERGETKEFTIDHVVTRQDVENLDIYNEASITGTAPNGATTNSNDNVTVDLTQLPELTLAKTSSHDEFLEDDEITYTFVVTNVGNVRIENVKVDDPMFENIELEKTTLGIGESTQGTATYTANREDVLNLNIHNEATVDGDNPHNENIQPDPVNDEVDVPLLQQPEIDFNKTILSINGEEYTEGMMYLEGDEIEYGFTVENVGNVVLENVRVIDAMFPDLEIELDKTSLGLEEVATGSFVHTVDREDVVALSITNNAEVTSENPNGDNPEDKEDNVTVDLDQQPSLELNKEVDTEVYQRGDIITYTFNVKNTGNVELSDLAFEDPMFENYTLPFDTLGIGEEQTFEIKHTASKDDVAKDYIFNHAIITGTAPNGGTTEANDFAVTVADPELIVVEKEVPDRGPIIIEIINKNTNELVNTIEVTDNCGCENNEPVVDESIVDKDGNAVIDDPTVEYPITDAPEEETPNEETPEEETPEEETSNEETPEEETSNEEISEEETSNEETSNEETSNEETSNEETPNEDAPEEETSNEEAPEEEAPEEEVSEEDTVIVTPEDKDDAPKAPVTEDTPDDIIKDVVEDEKDETVSNVEVTKDAPSEEVTKAEKEQAEQERDLAQTGSAGINWILILVSLIAVGFAVAGYTVYRKKQASQDK